MSSLRLINETTATSVSKVQVKDVFTSDFDIYKIEVISEGTTTHWTSMRYLNVFGAPLSGTVHGFAMHELKSYGASGENISTAGNKFNYLFIDDGSSSGVGYTMYVFNPTNTSQYTYMIGESGGYYSTSGSVSTKLIGSYYDYDELSGFEFTRYSGNYDPITIRTYGLRVD